MVNRLQHKGFIFLALIIIGMILLGASLQSIQFKPGLPIPGADPSIEYNQWESTSNGSAIDPTNWLPATAAVIFISIITILIICIIKKVKLKLILSVTAGLTVLLCLFLLLNQIKVYPQLGGSADSQTISNTSQFSYDISPTGAPPQILFNIVSVLVILITIAVAIWLFFQLAHRRQVDKLQSEADQALAAIQAGEFLENVIIRCYIQMEGIIKNEKGVERTESITPREFEHELVSKGIAPSSIHQLTCLFEKVRYGNKTLGLEDEQIAVDSLTDIRNSIRTNSKRYDE